MTESFWMVPTQTMRDLVDPLTDPQWQGSEGFSRERVEECVLSGLTDACPWDSGDAPMQDSEELSGGDYHARRVAYLVSETNYPPIILDVGVPGYRGPEYLIWDGNHRLAAALYRQDPWIAVDFSGAVSEFKEMFPVRRRPTQAEKQKHAAYLPEVVSSMTP
jgi:hypothetical protein